jgi:hypothetical protein
MKTNVLPVSYKLVFFNFLNTNKMKIILKNINYETNKNYILCYITLKDGSIIKEKYYNYNLCEAKKHFLKLLKSL